jgi:hypothetical protein
VDVEDCALLIDEKGCGGRLFEDNIFCKSLDIFLRRRFGRFFSFINCFLPGKPGGKLEVSLHGFRDFPSCEELPPVVHELEQVGELPHRFRGPEHEDAPRFEGIVKQREDFFLHLPFYIYEKVPAAEKIEPGKGRVL